MVNKVFLLLFLLSFSHTAFSQDRSGEKRPQAYLVSSGDTRAALSRPRTVNSAAENKNTVRRCRKDYRLEQQVFDLINQQRVRMSLDILQWNDEIAEIARQHSENMAVFDFFSHTDLDGLMVNDRADAMGIKRWRAIGENIAYNHGYENPAASAVERWMQSPAHRDNLLSSRWKESGIGIAVTEDGTYYFTEVFLLRK